MIGINYVGKRKERLANQMFQYAAAVSYTHLTLPTTPYV